MVKQISLIFFIIISSCKVFAQSEIVCDSLQILGVYYIDNMYLVNNHQKRTEYYALLNIKRWMHYRCFCTTEETLNSIKLKDKTITYLLKERKAFVSITDCYPFLRDIMRCTQDSMLIKNIEDSYMMHHIIDPAEKTEFISADTYYYNSKYDYRKFKTNRFLLVSIDFSDFWKRRPLYTYDNHVVVDFWLEPIKTGQKVIVAIPLWD